MCAIIQLRRFSAFRITFLCSNAGGFADGDIRWFYDGQLNVCYNCVDRHVDAGRGDTPAIIWEADEPGAAVTFTYKQVLQEVCRVANVLLKYGVRKGDTVAVYLPMVRVKCCTKVAGSTLLLHTQGCSIFCLVVTDPFHRLRHAGLCAHRGGPLGCLCRREHPSSLFPPLSRWPCFPPLLLYPLSPRSSSCRLLRRFPPRPHPRCTVQVGQHMPPL